MNNTLEKEFIVNYYDINYKKQALLSSIVNYLVDTSIEQSHERGVGVDYLHEKKLGWIIYKWNINIIKYPMYRDKIRVQTTPHSFNKFYSYRKFSILNEAGELLVEANSEWLIINTEKRRLVRIPDNMYEAYRIDKNVKEVIKFPEILELLELHEEKEFTIRYSDIDTNKHVNNVKYIDWALEVVPIDIVLNYKLENIKIKYEKETTYGESIKSLIEIRREETKVVCIHKITDVDGNKLTLGETVWVKQ